jgi:hypothetical protein
MNYAEEKYLPVLTYCNLFAVRKSKLGYNPVDIDLFVYSYCMALYSWYVDTNVLEEQTASIPTYSL